jgi:hypothetical protein
MSPSQSLDALRRANPRNEPGFDQAVDAAAADMRVRIDALVATDREHSRQLRPRRRLFGMAAGVALATAAAVAVFLSVSPSGGTPGVENAAAAIKKAATLSAASAEQSGTANVQMTHDGQLWADKTVRWNGDDVEITDQSPGGASSGLPLLVVNEVMYGHDPQHEGWVQVGPVSSIDPGSGTTPTDILAAVRDDMGGTTLHRIVDAMATGGGLVTTNPTDGSTVYRGTVPADQIARRTGFKEGHAIRVLPFGYVAHDQAANPASPLDTAVTVGGDGVIRKIAVTWGTWTYAVTYSDLGSTPALVAPANAQSLRDQRVTTTPTP